MRSKVHRVFGQIDARNTASARVLERLGMRREAHLVENEWVKGEWTDEVIYAVLAAEWAQDPTGATKLPRPLLTSWRRATLAFPYVRAGR